MTPIIDVLTPSWHPISLCYVADKSTLLRYYEGGAIWLLFFESKELGQLWVRQCLVACWLLPIAWTCADIVLTGLLGTKSNVVWTGTSPLGKCFGPSTIVHYTMIRPGNHVSGWPGTLRCQNICCTDKPFYLFLSFSLNNGQRSGGHHSSSWPGAK